MIQSRLSRNAPVRRRTRGLKLTLRTDTSHQHFTPTLRTDTSHRHFAPTLRTDTSHRHLSRRKSRMQVPLPCFGQLLLLPLAFSGPSAASCCSNTNTLAFDTNSGGQSRRARHMGITRERSNQQSPSRAFYIALRACITRNAQLLTFCTTKGGACGIRDVSFALANTSMAFMTQSHCLLCWSLADIDWSFDSLSKQTTYTLLKYF